MNKLLLALAIIALPLCLSSQENSTELEKQIGQTGPIKISTPNTLQDPVLKSFQIKQIKTEFAKTFSEKNSFILEQKNPECMRLRLRLIENAIFDNLDRYEWVDLSKFKSNLTIKYYSAPSFLSQFLKGRLLLDERPASKHEKAHPHADTMPMSGLQAVIQTDENTFWALSRVGIFEQTYYLYKIVLSTNQDGREVAISYNLTHGKTHMENSQSIRTFLGTCQ